MLFAIRTEPPKFLLLKDDSEQNKIAREVLKKIYTVETEDELDSIVNFIKSTV